MPRLASSGRCSRSAEGGPSAEPPPLVRATLDACRSLNAPTAADWLAPLDPAKEPGFQALSERPNVTVFLSTVAGRNAQSFSQIDPAHSPFTSVLAQLINVESQSLSTLWSNILSGMAQDVNGDQIPALYTTAATDRIWLKRGVDEVARDNRAWQNALDAGSRNCMTDYVTKFPAGDFALSSHYLLSLSSYGEAGARRCFLVEK